MNKLATICAAVGITLATSQVARAESHPVDDSAAASPFAGDAVSDDSLDAVRGGTAPFAALTVATASRIVDDAARSDLRVSAAVGRTEMDVWWGTVGSELIAQSVRAAGVR